MFFVMTWMIRGAFVFWIGAFGIGLADMALKLHDHTVTAYRKGPISAGEFTRMMTDGHVASKTSR